jgi:hypothetical protein
MSYLSSHPEYDAGSILTAPVNSVKSMGANVIDWSLFPAQSYMSQELGGGFEIDSNGVWKITGGATQSYVVNPHTLGSVPAFALKAGTYKFSVKVVNGTVPTNQTIIQIRSVSDDHWYPLKNGDTFTLPQNDGIMVYAWISTTAGSFSFMPMLSRGTNAVEYTPYRAPVYYPIHRDIRALEGYGYGINADCYNYIDFERNVFVKKVERVDLSTLNWTFYSDTPRYVSRPSDIKYPSSNSIIANIQADKYTTKSANAAWTEQSGIAVGTDALIVYGSESPTGYAYYELATPTETDISEYIDSDVIIVSAGGHLEFENENDLGVPYSATYQSEPETQGGE